MQRQRVPKRSWKARSRSERRMTVGERKTEQAGGCMYGGLACPVVGDPMAVGIDDDRPGRRADQAPAVHQRASREVRARTPERKNDAQQSVERQGDGTDSRRQLLALRLAAPINGCVVPPAQFARSGSRSPLSPKL